MQDKIHSGEFYDTYYGHKAEHLERIISAKESQQPVIYLAGDSSLDNKFWLDGCVKRNAPNPLYQSVLNPPLCRPDVAYWVNQVQSKYVCINGAVEERALSDQFTHSDYFIQQNITTDDILVISIGGNDFALKPSWDILVSTGLLLYCTPQWVIDAGYALPLYYLVDTLKRKLEDYIAYLTVNTRPKQVLVCSIYYPCTKGRGWADRILKWVDAEFLHQMIDAFHYTAVCKLDNVIPLKLSEVLDCEDSQDYVQRVEPSDLGGEKIARAIVQFLKDV